MCRAIGSACSVVHLSSKVTMVNKLVGRPRSAPPITLSTRSLQVDAKLFSQEHSLLGSMFHLSASSALAELVTPFNNKLACSLLAKRHVLPEMLGARALCVKAYCTVYLQAYRLAPAYHGMLSPPSHVQAFSATTPAPPSRSLF